MTTFVEFESPTAAGSITVFINPATVSKVVRGLGGTAYIVSLDGGEQTETSSDADSAAADLSSTGILFVKLASPDGDVWLNPAAMGRIVPVGPLVSAVISEDGGMQTLVSGDVFDTALALGAGGESLVTTGIFSPTFENDGPPEDWSVLEPWRWVFVRRGAVTTRTMTGRVDVQPSNSGPLPVTFSLPLQNFTFANPYQLTGIWQPTGVEARVLGLEEPPTSIVQSMTMTSKATAVLFSPRVTFPPQMIQSIYVSVSW